MHLFHSCPVMEVLTHQNFLQLLWLKELHQALVTYLEEASFKLLKHTRH